jgi:hypothetical protein
MMTTPVVGDGHSVPHDDRSGPREVAVPVFGDRIACQVVSSVAVMNQR